MIYLCSSVLLITALMSVKKSEDRKNFWRSLILSVMSVECGLCTVAGLMTIFHIPADIDSISVVNLAIAIVIFICLCKTKTFQKYYVDAADTIFMILFAAAICCVFYKRFTADLAIIFETSDPGVHLKMAMNFVNDKQVSGMYIGQLVNGLLIESLGHVFGQEMVYKPFIIQYGINLFMAGAVFWTAVSKYGKHIFMRLAVYVSVFIYTFGYPYNDFLYGFVYLQMAITAACYLISLLQDYMDQKEDKWFFDVLTGSGCLGVSIGYTLFAPPVYISVLCLLAYKAYTRKQLLIQNRLFLSRQFILRALRVFFIPSLITIWILLVAPRLYGTPTDYGTALMAEGAIYRNLYSDFLLYIVPAVYGIVHGIKKRRMDLLVFLGPAAAVYQVVFLYLMLTDRVSTYYYYKLNYFLWMLVMVSFVMGMEKLLEQDKVVFYSALFGIAILTAVYRTGIEYSYKEKNINYMPYTDAEAFFRINTCNLSFETIRTQIPEELIEVSGEVYKMEPDDPVVFIGGWVELFWYEAVTNQRFDGLHTHSYEDVIRYFQTGGYGDYAVVVKGLEGMERYQQFLTDHCVYENGYAYIICR